jgi:hypothetical protein
MEEGKQSQIATNPVAGVNLDFYSNNDQKYNRKTALVVRPVTPVRARISSLADEQSQHASPVSSTCSSPKSNISQSSPNTTFSTESTFPRVAPPAFSISNFAKSPPSWEINYSISLRPNYNPRFQTDYFEVRSSDKGGLGAFATRNIEKGTAIMAEEPLFCGDFGDVSQAYQNFTREQAEEYLSLHAWTGSSRGDKQLITCIFATNRYVRGHNPNNTTCTGFS